MTTLLVILFAILALIYSLVLAVTPARTKHSVFELKRREDHITIRRERLLDTVLAFRQFLLAVLAGGMLLVGVYVWQGWGMVVFLMVLLLVPSVARMQAAARLAMKLYGSIEKDLLDVVEKQPFLTKLLLIHHLPAHDQKLESTEQLLHLVETSGQVLDDEQRAIIKNGIGWHHTPVHTVMTARDDIVSVKHAELLGPLVLDDLHRTGHTRFPVMKRGLDMIIGVLDISTLLEIDAGKSTQTVERSMSPQPPRIEAHASLPEVLALLQKSHQHMVVVVDEDGKTVGLVTLSDITNSLLGNS